MINTMLSFDQQRLRFERHHRKMVHIECDYTWDETGFVDVNLSAVFTGWMLCLHVQNKDEVELHYSHTYGWKFEFVLTGFTVSSPSFENLSDQNKAVEWAKQNGFLIIHIQD